MWKPSRLNRAVRAAVLLLALAACGKAPAKPEAAPKSDEFVEPGWGQSEGVAETSISYQDGTSRTDFSITCAQTTKALRVVAPNPIDGATPAAGERASFVLGAAPFEAPVTQTLHDGLSFLVVDIAVTPPLLIALGDAKTARLLYRDGSSETGVDEDGKIVDFARRCARLTGIEPAL